MSGEQTIEFDDLPMVASDQHKRAVHLATGQYFVKRNGKAHDDMTCSHLDDTQLVGNPTWRVATSDQARALHIDWCESCS